MNTPETRAIPLEDVAACLQSCSDTFDQLAALCGAIAEGLPEHSRLRALATLAATVAADAANYPDDVRGQIQSRGVRS